MQILKGIYVLTFPNGKKYLGKSCSKYGIHSRWIKYKRYACKDQPKLYNALKKYGAENVKFNVLLICNDNNIIKNIEKQLIEVWKLQNDEYGYNIGCGGENDQFGLKRSLETKNRYSLASKGNKRRVGKYHSEETKKKISESKKGKPSPHKGKKYPKEFGEKLSKIKKKLFNEGKLEKINKGSFKKGMIPWNKKINK